MEYCEALKQAISYIEEHLNEPIQVFDVARHVGYSYYHLTRIFHAIVGENIGSYIKKRRLSNAGKALLEQEDKVIDIALRNGFDSAEAFSRAFKGMFHMSPIQYRANRVQTKASIKEPLREEDLRHRMHHITIQPDIVEVPNIQIAGIRGRTTLKDNRLKQLWESFYERIDEIPDQLPHGMRYGICEIEEDDFFYQMDEEEVFSELLGVAISSFEHLNDSFVSYTIPGGKYAVFTHKGSLEMLPQTLDYIWGTWLLNTKEKIANRIAFESYDASFCGYDDPKTTVKLYIPIL